MNPIAELLKEILVSTHRGSMDKVVERTGLAYRTVADQTDGRINPSVEVIKASWLVTGDPWLKLLLEPKGWELVPKATQVFPQKDLEAEIADVILMVSRLIEKVRLARQERRYTKQERIELLRILGQLRLEQVELETALEQEFSQVASPWPIEAGTSE